MITRKRVALLIQLHGGASPNLCDSMLVEHIFHSSRSPDDDADRAAYIYYQETEKRVGKVVRKKKKDWWP